MQLIRKEIEIIEATKNDQPTFLMENGSRVKVLLLHTFESVQKR